MSCPPSGPNVPPRPVAPSGSSSRYQCAGPKDGPTILVSSSFSTAKETAAELEALRDAI